MITGFNTDIVHGGVTYHVQTEDKGLEMPLILSLVYQGGTILASKRSPYDDLLQDGLDEQILEERLQKQHKLMCAAIKTGRIEDLKRMTLNNAAQKKAITIPPAVEKIPRPAVPPIDEPVPPPPILENENLVNEAPALVVIKEKRVLVEKQPEPEGFTVGKIPKPDDGLIFEVPEVIAEPVIEEVQIVEEEMILPAEAVVIISENLNKEPVVEDNKLRISLINDLNFKGGERKTLNIRVGRGNEDFGLTKAHVVIKILGSAFRPLIFHAKTDSNGVAVVNIQLPNFKAGRAVLLIRAMFDGEEAEWRQVIAQG